MLWPRFVNYTNNHVNNQVNIHALLFIMIIINNLYFPVFQVEELDLPVSRNQNLIVKSFCRHQRHFCNDFLEKRKEVEEERMIILKAVRLIYDYKSNVLWTFVYIF